MGKFVMFPDKSAIVGKKSLKLIGTSEKEFFLIFGPEIMKGILIPPSIQSHFPLLRG